MRLSHKTNWKFRKKLKTAFEDIFWASIFYVSVASAVIVVSFAVCIGCYIFFVSKVEKHIEPMIERFEQKDFIKGFPK